MLKLLYTKESTASFKWEKEPETDNSFNEPVTELSYSRDKGTLQTETRLGGLRDSIRVKGKTTSTLLAHVTPCTIGMHQKQRTGAE